ncbi:MAG: hypothetical protein AAFQ82_24615, partial [Myxococcota bacterium]
QDVFVVPNAPAQFGVLQGSENAVVGAYVLGTGETEFVAYSALEPVTRRLGGDWGLAQRGARLFAFSVNGVLEVEFGAGSLTLGDISPLPANATEWPARGFDTSPCPDANGEIIGEPSIVLSSAVGVVRLGENFEMLPALELGDVHASGCVRDDNEVMRRALVDSVELWLETESGEFARVPSVSSPLGLDFVGQFSSVWATPEVALTRLDARSASVLRPITVSAATGFGSGLAEPLLAVPLALEAGDVDGSSTPDDLVALIPFDSQRQALFVALNGRDGNSTAAPFVLDQEFRDPWMVLIDLDRGDGRPDVVIGDRSPEGSSRFLRLQLGR